MEKEIKILVVEDEPDLNDMISDYLIAVGYSVVKAFSGKEALYLFNKNSDFSMVLLDLMIPGIDGYDVARQIRKISTIPLIMITARSDEADKVLGLEIGADDYITKPFSLKEMAARVRAQIRRARNFNISEESENQVLKHGPLTLDFSRRQLTIKNSVLDLTSSQFALLKCLMEQPGRAFSRMDLLKSFQDDPYEGYERTIDAHIKNLRKLLKLQGIDGAALIKTVWGLGYKLEEKGDNFEA